MQIIKTRIFSYGTYHSAIALLVPGVSGAALRPALLSGTALLGAALFGLADPTTASADQQFLKHGSLLISSSIYDKTQGNLATLTAGPNGTTLPKSATATTKAISDNNY